jgi:hypothetical protein
MLARSGPIATRGHYSYEVKWDGFRGILSTENRRRLGLQWRAQALSGRNVRPPRRLKSSTCVGGVSQVRGRVPLLSLPQWRVRTRPLRVRPGLCLALFAAEDVRPLAALLLFVRISASIGAS